MNDETKYVNSKTAREIAGVTTKTLRIWDAQNKIRTCRIASGQRRYNLKDLKDIRGNHASLLEKKKVCYCRVSSKKQMDDLERQKDFFRQRYPDYILVTDVGSGINWKRKGLQTLLEFAMQGCLGEIVVAHRDRFAFELLESIFSRQGVKLVVLDEDHGESKDDELTDDILSIIHVYSCRAMGRRRYNKSSQITSGDHSRTTTSSETVERNEESRI